MAARSRAMTVVGWLIASRLVIAGLGVIGVATFATHNGDGTFVLMDNTAALNPVTVWHKWDSIWYERIATHGYGYELDTPKGQATADKKRMFALVTASQMASASAASFFCRLT